MLVQDSGLITAGTFGIGDSSNLEINVQRLTLENGSSQIGTSTFGTRSGINSTVELQGIGNGGNLEIIANNLSLVDGGSIAADSLGQGNAGNINIQAQKIDITGVSLGEPVFNIEQKSLPSSISAFAQGNFNAGSITINTDSLNLTDRGNLSVSNSSNGNSGNLDITATKLNLDRSGNIEAKVNTGSQGNINLTTNNIFLNNDSEITAAATGTATGGNIFINNIDNLVLLLAFQPSVLSAWVSRAVYMPRRLPR